MTRYHYTECGLDNVWLTSGIEQQSFGEYGPAVAIRDEKALWELLGRSIANQDSRMVGQELRFLCTLLDWTQTNLGRRLGYKDGQMVASWEKARHTPVPLYADTFIRGAYREMLGEKPMITWLSTRLQEIKPETVTHIRVWEDGPKGWTPMEVPEQMAVAG